MFRFVPFWYNQLNFLKLSFKKNYDALTSKEHIHAVGDMSWTGPSNMVELFHGSSFSHVFDFF